MRKSTDMKALSVRRLVGTILLSVFVATTVRAEDDIAWNHRATQGAVTLTANPLSTESRTAFYSARGFTAETIRPYARVCGLSFGMQNHGTATLVTRLAEWHAIGADGKRISLRLPDAWDTQWEKAGVPQHAQIAFKWAQFQAENSFEPGDWIMGMATLENVPIPPFRIIARYHDNKGKHEIILEKLECSRD